MNSVDFINNFRNFLTKISLILLNFVTFFKESVGDFIFKDKNIVGNFYLDFCQKFWPNILKFTLFHQRQHEISVFSPL